MKRVFADTYFYVAMLSPRDAGHTMAKAFAADFEGTVVTTQWILLEVANTLCASSGRAKFLSLLSDVENAEDVKVLPADRESFKSGCELFSKRPDKSWSLTDCISFEVMKQHKLTDALTADHHFEQAGFTALLRQEATT